MYIISKTPLEQYNTPKVVHIGQKENFVGFSKTRSRKCC